jgi:hypothetical protein
MSTSTHPDLQALRAAVQKNCHISDARHAADYTLCIYLLKMREYYRWEKGHGFGAALEGEEVGEWLREREQLWDSLGEASFEPMTLGRSSLDPFDTEAINRALLPHGLVYSGGIGRKSTPHFFLGRLEDRREYGGFTLLISGEEFARDLSAPPAMTLGRTIFIRRESLRRMLWEKFQEWRWNERRNAMGRAVAHYGFDRDVETALDAMTEAELEAAVLHEIGEVWAGDTLGDEWEEMLTAIGRTRAELIARAVRDHLADAVSTVPRLLRKGREASVHFWVANLTGMRRELFPSLAPAYECWAETGDAHALRGLIETAGRHWLDIAERMLEAYRRHDEGCAEHIDALAGGCARL